MDSWVFRPPMAEWTQACESKVMQETRDLFWMGEALRLARRGEGLTRPNPPVGALVVRGNVAAGRGYHRKAGGPHAEVYALRQAGSQARGGTLYVTLEPCCTWGRTPPCTDAILAAGIRRVVVATRDPNPRHAGRGLAVLRRAGLRVDTGVREGEARDLIAPFAVWIRRRRPMVTLKLAASLDGGIADATGRSKWISGESSRREAHDLRRRSDAIMVGAGTVLADDPSLLPRPARGRCPFRIVVDARGHVSPEARVFRGREEGGTLVATTRRCPASRCAAYAMAGAEVVVLPGSGGGVSLPALFRHLGRAGILRVMVEGGGTLAESLFRAGLVDEMVLFLAPLVIGGQGVRSVGGRGWLLRRAPRLRLVEERRCGDDVMLRYLAWR